MMTYQIKTRYWTRQAWISLGKAQEAKASLKYEQSDWRKMVLAGVVRDQVWFARQAMRTAILYRQHEVL